MGIALAVNGKGKREGLTHVRSRVNKRPRMVRRRFSGRRAVPWIQLTIATWIVALWSVAQIRATFDTDFNPPESLNAVTLLAAGFLFGSALLGTREGNDRRNEDE